MANRTQDYQNLPEKLKKINAALTEMNEVITGGTFNEAQIWGENAAADISAYMKSLTVDADLKVQIDKLLKGLPTSSTVSGAVKTVMTGVQKAVDEIFKINSELGASGRLDAFNKLNNPHPEGDYDISGNENYGFFPALEGVINAGFDTQVDLDNYLDPLKKVVAVAAGAQSILFFVDYAAGSLLLLQSSLTVQAA